MKKIYFTVLAIIMIQVSNAQQRGQSTPNIGCIDKTIKMQSEELRAGLTRQGMEPFKDAMISMESQTPFPIALQLVKGKLYQFVYIGSNESSKIKMEIYDGNDKKLDDKTTNPTSRNPNSNYILYSFIPEKTDIFLIVLTQKQKQKSICGSFTVYQKMEAKPVTDTTKKQPPIPNKTATPAKSPNKKATVPNNPRYVAPK